MKLTLVAILCYFIGCINPAYLIGKMKGFDIRDRGSFNAGASNVVINVGKKAGVFTALFDIFKSFLCFRLASRMFPLVPFAAVFCSFFCVLGHVFPVFLKFRGGKGFACLGGIILGFNYKVFLFLLVLAVIIVLTSNYLCIVTSFVSMAFPIIYAFLTKDFTGMVILLFMGSVITAKHIPNFKRIRTGTEARFSGLWNREKEEERIRLNSQKLND